MESRKPGSRYSSQNSKKRVFSSEGFEEVEVLEVPPPINPTSKSKPSKRKQKVIVHEIIDLDLEEGSGSIVHIDGNIDKCGKRKEAWSNSSAGLSKLASDGTGIEPLNSIGKKSKKSRVSSSTHKQSPSVATDIPLAITKPIIGGIASAPIVQGSVYIQNGSTSVRAQQRTTDEVLEIFNLFKKFDTVEDSSDHHFLKNDSSAKQLPKNWAKRIQEEWKMLEKDLPDTIFVRVYESRMDLLRAMIVGADGTPYHDGLFFFDVFFPSTYPNVPPRVHYHSRGLRINPNLYQCGKVCLSLLNTWGGSEKEKWIRGTSTMLQVLISIQGLILNAKPYFNEPGFANSSGTEAGEKASLQYNEDTFILSLKTMIYNMRRPPKHFEAFVAGHFRNRSREILVSCKAYMDGAQVGCLVKGGIQDVDEGDKSCSEQLRTKLAGTITMLVNAFTKIGANNCREFLSLSRKGMNGPQPATTG